MRTLKTKKQIQKLNECKKIEQLYLTPQAVAALRESARIRSVHYSTQLAGNKLSLEEVAEVLGYTKQIQNTPQLRMLTPQQRLVLDLFKNGPEINTNQVAALLHIHPRTASVWCKQWCDQGFLTVANTSKKRRSFSLGQRFLPLLVA